jgi:hypothetical protein
MSNRRNFLRVTTASGVAIACGVVTAQTPAPSSAPMLSEQDPQAIALGYVTLATRVDKTKYPKFAQGQHCAACQLYQGPATAPVAPCTVFGGKQVNGPGWCSAYTPRPG